ncbi:DEKNAAC100133 [Brettanomyces naardenensis]|uniref:DEKNAAC100133 n=1 Tax=Brettanomyces naardenensis TaxID=13370 RepID=A0A448YEK5_BRENA|nr:DEKNAAC100133 [Brettanomyces naardenensis]
MSVPPEGRVSPSRAVNMIQLSKPFLSSKEITYLMQNNIGNSDQIRMYRLKKRETFQFLIRLIKILQFPVKVLQNCSYFYQTFYLFTDDFPKYANLHYEVGITALFVSLKMNDFIKKLTLVLQEGNTLRAAHVSAQEFDEQRRTIIGMEKTMMECESFDFRNYCIEDLLVKFTKLYKIPEKESYVCWSVLNDLYLTELPLELPAHYNAVIAIRTGLMIFNAVSQTKTNYNIDLHRINMRAENEGLISGVSLLLEYYIDNYSTTFLRDALKDVHMVYESKELVDEILNVKIEFSGKFNSRKGSEGVVSREDLYFQPRNPDTGKYGCIRFVYNKRRYVEEVKDRTHERNYEQNE